MLFEYLFQDIDELFVTTRQVSVAWTSHLLGIRLLTGGLPPATGHELYCPMLRCLFTKLFLAF